jgi:SAM-dependent methyltransferase
VKTTLLRLLSRAHLLRPTYRAWERARAARYTDAHVTADDGLPVPPPHLIVRVAGTPDPTWFLESGRAAREAIDDALEDEGAAPRDVLDFGCGCGRVLRTWAGHDGAVAGSDLSGDAVEWCRENLPFARVETNGLSPPLAFADGAFDFAYALSVLTHLPEAIQHEWLDELHRVVRPGGLVLVTTHGERYLERLDAAEQRRFRAGELIVRWGEVPGTNLCTTFHPPEWVREHLLPHGFEEVAFVPEGARGNPHQDLFLLRRSA